MSPLRSKTSQDLQQWRLLRSGTSLTAVTRAGSTRSFWSSAFQLKLKEPTDLKFKCQLAVQLKIEYTSIFPSSHSFDSNKSGTPNHQVHGSSADLYEDLIGHHNVFPAAASHRQWNDLLCSLEAASNEAYPLCHLVLSTSRLMSSVSWLLFGCYAMRAQFSFIIVLASIFVQRQGVFAIAPTLFPHALAHT